MKIIFDLATLISLCGRPRRVGCGVVPAGVVPGGWHASVISSSTVACHLLPDAYRAAHARASLPGTHILFRTRPVLVMPAY